MAIVDPRSMRSYPAPPVAILSATVGGFPAALRDRIEIRSGSGAFQAQYTALTFVRPELAQFKYKLEGLDADWVEAAASTPAR